MLVQITKKKKTITTLLAAKGPCGQAPAGGLARREGRGELDTRGVHGAVRAVRVRHHLRARAPHGAHHLLRHAYCALVSARIAWEVCV